PNDAMREQHRFFSGGQFHKLLQRPFVTNDLGLNRVADVDRSNASVLELRAAVVAVESRSGGNLLKLLKDLHVLGWRLPAVGEPYQDRNGLPDLHGGLDVADAHIGSQLSGVLIGNLFKRERGGIRPCSYVISDRTQGI